MLKPPSCSCQYFTQLIRTSLTLWMFIRGNRKTVLCGETIGIVVKRWIKKSKLENLLRKYNRKYFFKLLFPLHFDVNHVIHIITRICVIIFYRKFRKIAVRILNDESSVCLSECNIGRIYRKKFCQQLLACFSFFFMYIIIFDCHSFYFVLLSHFIFKKEFFILLLAVHFGGYKQMKILL